MVLYLWGYRFNGILYLNDESRNPIFANGYTKKENILTG